MFPQRQQLEEQFLGSRNSPKNANPETTAAYEGGSTTRHSSQPAVATLARASATENACASQEEGTPPYGTVETRKVGCPYALEAHVQPRQPKQTSSLRCGYAPGTLTAHSEREKTTPTRVLIPQADKRHRRTELGEGSPPVTCCATQLPPCAEKICGMDA